MTQTNQMRRGFTMIELIFVIVIIGILAAVAIPKLTATRDDAKVSKEISNLKTCIDDEGAMYTATGGLNKGQSSACQKIETNACFTLSEDNATGTLTVANGSNADTWCTQASTGAQASAASMDLVRAHVFGGTGVTR